MGVDLLVLRALNWGDAEVVQDGVKNTSRFERLETPLTYARLQPAATNTREIKALDRHKYRVFYLDILFSPYLTARTLTHCHSTQRSGTDGDRHGDREKRLGK
jgi:hypothetical protein